MRNHFLWTAPALIVLATLIAGCSDRYMEVSISELETRSPFRAKVERIYAEDFGQLPSGITAIVALRTETGQRVALGGERIPRNFLTFAHSLEVGKTYEFPAVWVEFKSKHQN